VSEYSETGRIARNAAIKETILAIRDAGVHMTAEQVALALKGLGWKRFAAITWASVNGFPKEQQ
jgi:hypothetical protein